MTGMGCAVENSINHVTHTYVHAENWIHKYVCCIHCTDIYFS